MVTQQIWNTNPDTPLSVWKEKQKNKNKTKVNYLTDFIKNFQKSDLFTRLEHYRKMKGWTIQKTQRAHIQNEDHEVAIISFSIIFNKSTILVGFFFCPQHWAQLGPN